MNEPKPKRIKKEYDEGFRRNAVALVENSGRSLQEIATELGGVALEPARLDQAARAQPAPAGGDAG